MGTRAAKRAEARLVLVEIEDEVPPPVVFDEHDLAVIGMYEDDAQREAHLGECRHGCSGSPSCTSGACTFTCHAEQP